MEPAPVVALRVWRMRKRREHIDATLVAAVARWELTFTRNGEPMLTWRYADEAAARAEAGRRQRDLERAGWVSHW